MPPHLYQAVSIMTQRLPGRALFAASVCITRNRVRNHPDDRLPAAATEMLLVSQAADNAVAQIDFSPLAGKTVYLDATGIEKEVIDRGYLISIVKQQVVAAGASPARGRDARSTSSTFARAGSARTGTACSSARRPFGYRAWCRACQPIFRRSPS